MKHGVSDDRHGVRGMWARLAIMSVLSFFATYALMYMMVDEPANVCASLNQVFTAGMMTAAMVVIECS